VAELLLATSQPKGPNDWSPDGRLALFRSPHLRTHRLVLTFGLCLVQGDRTPFPIVQTIFDERYGQFSPDGRWIAYQSNECGRYEIYVQASLPSRRQRT
jgi:Tol biopolymer transport system component